jgi:hypothetical protein
VYPATPHNEAVEKVVFGTGIALAQETNLDSQIHVILPVGSRI